MIRGNLIVSEFSTFWQKMQNNRLFRCMPWMRGWRRKKRNALWKFLTEELGDCRIRSVGVILRSGMPCSKSPTWLGDNICHICARDMHFYQNCRWSEEPRAHERSASNITMQSFLMEAVLTEMSQSYGHFLYNCLLKSLWKFICTFGNPIDPVRLNQ